MAQSVHSHCSTYACHSGIAEMPSALSNNHCDIIIKVKLYGKKACCISGGTMQLAPTNCSIYYVRSSLLFEPMDQGLPARLRTAPDLVQV